MSGGDRKGTFKVEFLKDVERRAQQKWEDMKVYEMDAPQTGEGTSGIR
jgi:leucyl-tRNA synthetase